MSLTFYIKLSDSCTRYFRHGQLHRIDGPAEVYDDSDFTWMQYNEYHRKDGLALKHLIGISWKIEEYYHRGKKYDP
jgi:hypothetical protein